MAVAGEPWSPLVIRDVFIGINRFDDLQRDLDISRKVLAERLRHLVDAGPPVLYRHRACGRVTHVEPRCAACGEVLRSGDVDVERGPGVA